MNAALIPSKSYWIGRYYIITTTVPSLLSCTGNVITVLVFRLQDASRWTFLPQWWTLLLDRTCCSNQPRTVSLRVHYVYKLLLVVLTKCTLWTKDVRGRNFIVSPATSDAEWTLGSKQILFIRFSYIWI